MQATMVCSLSNDLAEGDPGHWIKDWRDNYAHVAHYGRQRDRMRRKRKRGMERRAIRDFIQAELEAGL